MYKRSLWSGRFFRTSDDLDISDLPAEWAEFMIWRETNTYEEIIYYPTEKGAYAAEKIPLLLSEMGGLLLPTSSALDGFYVEQFGHPQEVMGQRETIRNDYRAQILELDENYDFGDMSDQFKPYFCFDFVAEENSDHIMLPFLLGRKKLRRIFCNEVAVAIDPLKFDFTTGRYDTTVVAGEHWEFVI